MKLEDFIKKLKKIEKKTGGKLKVVMADNIPVTEPIFLKEEKKVVITDKK